MNLHVGTSGFAYEEWKGSFYPQDLPAKEMLRYYGERFGAVEINNSFYRMPKASVLEGWAAEVPAEFKFVIKAPQRITHFQRLKESGESVGFLLQAAGALGERLGPLLFQLPPNLKKDAPRLREFLPLLQRAPAAFEFRHASWFDDEVFALLREFGVALCIAEAEEGVEVPFVCTADWGYLRMRMGDYTDKELKERLEGRARPGVDRRLHLLQARGRGERAEDGGAAAGTGRVAGFTPPNRRAEPRGPSPAAAAAPARSSAARTARRTSAQPPRSCPESRGRR